MLLIKKGREPRWLAGYRASFDAAFDRLSAGHKDQLRQLLVDEQRGVCCYCMSRIKALPSSTKIEHWAPESANEEQSLAYANLLASCKGGEGNPPKLQHCDTKKANRSVTLNPTRPELLATLRYLPLGRIVTRDDLQGEIDDVLGLNIDKLTRARASAVQAVVAITKNKHAGQWPAEIIDRLQQRLEQETIASPYVGAILYWLKKKRKIAA